MRRLSLCCQSTTVAHLSWQTWPWQFCGCSSLRGGGNLHSCHICSPVFTELHQMHELLLLFFLCCTVYPNIVEAHGPSVGFHRLYGVRFVSAGGPRRIKFRFDSTIHQGGIIGWVRPRPSRLFCLLQSSDVQPARSLMGFVGTEWIRAFACDYYIFIPLAEPSDSYASSQQGVVTTLRRSGNIFLWSNSNWSAEAWKLITSSQLLVVLLE